MFLIERADVSTDNKVEDLHLPGAQPVKPGAKSCVALSCGRSSVRRASPQSNLSRFAQ